MSTVKWARMERTGMAWPVDDLLGLVEYFTEVATTDPISGLLLALGGLLTAFSIGLFGYLSLRGFLASLFRAGSA